MKTTLLIDNIYGGRTNPVDPAGAGLVYYWNLLDNFIFLAENITLTVGQRGPFV